MESNADRCLTKGTVERIGETESVVRLEVPPAHAQSHLADLPDHQAALSQAIDALREARVLADISQIQAVGHRTVHGGERFASSVLIDDEVVSEMLRCAELAPLHNPQNLRGYDVARKLMPKTPQVAVFDTAFHRTLPRWAYLYGLPFACYRGYGIRHYGFHGTSHRPPRCLPF